jgi:hypothetical protein
MMRSLSLRMRVATASRRGSALALAAAWLAALRALLAAPRALLERAPLDAARFGALAVRLAPELAARADVERLALPAPELVRLAAVEPLALERLAAALEPELVRLAAVEPPELERFLAGVRVVVFLAGEDALALLVAGPELEPELDEPSDVDPALLLGCGIFPPRWNDGPTAP